jgi:hypothetical protein
VTDGHKAFDLLYLDGQDLRKTRQIERIRISRPHVG